MELLIRLYLLIEMFIMNLITSRIEKKTSFNTQWLITEIDKLKIMNSIYFVKVYNIYQ